MLITVPRLARVVGLADSALQPRQPVSPSALNGLRARYTITVSIIICLCSTQRAAFIRTVGNRYPRHTYRIITQGSFRSQEWWFPVTPFDARSLSTVLSSAHDTPTTILRISTVLFFASVLKCFLNLGVVTVPAFVPGHPQFLTGISYTKSTQSTVVTEYSG